MRKKKFYISRPNLKTNIFYRQTKNVYDVLRDTINVSTSRLTTSYIKIMIYFESVEVYIKIRRNAFRALAGIQVK